VKCVWVRKELSKKHFVNVNEERINHRHGQFVCQSWSHRELREDNSDRDAKNV